MDKIKEDHGYAELVKDIKKSVQDKKDIGMWIPIFLLPTRYRLT